MVFLTILASFPQVSEARSFYVDAREGKDANPGTSPAMAWQTLERVGRADLRAGDRVLLTPDQSHVGPLRLSAKGSPAAPIVIASAGSGRATVDGGAGDGIVLDGCADVSIQNLILVGAGRKANDGRGVYLRQTKRARVDRVEVSGFRLAGVETAGDEDSRITRVFAHDNGFAGIHVFGDSEGIPRAKRCYIGDCRAIDNPGDPKNLTNHSGNGIVVSGVDGCLIEYCEAAGNGADMPRKGNGPVGIWAWNADGVTIQHCISHHNQSPGMDGGGFDLDGGVTNSVLQYNLSYANVGTGYLMCQYGGARPWRGNLIRYNVSYHDGSKNFQSGIGIWDDGGSFSDAQFLHNTIVNPKHAVNSGHAMPGFVFQNNVFLAGEEVVTGKTEGARFECNLFWRGAGVGAGSATLHVDPKLNLPSSVSELPTNPRELGSMRFFRPLAGSPCLEAGISTKDAGERDLFGQRVPAKPTLGASAKLL